jgi:alpha-beta hydrolase superfamily lysophospholipase
MRIIGFLPLLFMALPVFAQQKTVHFSSVDGCRIEAFYLAPSSGAPVFVNVHGLGSDKNEWGSFQTQLKAAGYGYLSLDLRGHGGSLTCGGKKMHYTRLDEAGWNAASRDIEAAAAWLGKRGIKAERLVFCGASVGANLVLKAAAEGDAKPAAVVLLSPGLSYAGVRIDGYFTAPRTFRVLSAASRPDGYAWESVATLNRAAAAKGLQTYALEAYSGHGVDMFKTPSVIPAILSWVSAPAPAGQK